MKLPEADFRPKRRAGYVPSSRRRKIPLLRVVLIVVAAALVYRHFDHFWPGLKGWIHPSSQTKGAHGLKHVDLSPYIYSADSSQIFLTLGQGPTREKDACAELEHLHEGLCAQERAALKKAGWMHALNKPILSKMEVSLPHAFGDESPTGASTLLVVLEGWDSSGSFHYTRKGGDTLSPWCDVARGCLTSPLAHLPMIQGKLMDSSSEELVARWHSSSAKVFPVLPGIVSHKDSLGPQSYQITLYHGNELYTSYGSLQSLAPGLKPGVQVDLSRSLGEAASMDSASLAGAATPVAKTSEKTKAGTPLFRYVLEFRVEQAGMPEDPMEFLAGALPIVTNTSNPEDVTAAKDSVVKNRLNTGTKKNGVKTTAAKKTPVKNAPSKKKPGLRSGNKSHAP